jgi:hypothetical protein
VLILFAKGFTSMCSGFPTFHSGVVSPEWKKRPLHLVLRAREGAGCSGCRKRKLESPTPTHVLSEGEGEWLCGMGWHISENT